MAWTSPEDPSLATTLEGHWCPLGPVQMFRIHQCLSSSIKPQVLGKMVHLRGKHSCTLNPEEHINPTGLLVMDKPSCRCRCRGVQEQLLHTAVVAGSLGSVPVWPLSSAAAQAAVAAAPFPALHVEAKPPAVPTVTSALLAVRKASCCRGKGDRRPP